MIQAQLTPTMLAGIQSSTIETGGISLSYLHGIAMSKRAPARIYPSADTPIF
jgi:hypothetical protein